MMRLQPAEGRRAKSCLSDHPGFAWFMVGIEGEHYDENAPAIRLCKACLGTDIFQVRFRVLLMSCSSQVLFLLVCRGHPLAAGRSQWPLRVACGLRGGSGVILAPAGDRKRAFEPHRRISKLFSGQIYRLARQRKATWRVPRPWRTAHLPRSSRRATSRKWRRLWRPRSSASTLTKAREPGNAQMPRLEWFLRWSSAAWRRE